jgi:hypothetical protein
MARVGLKLTPGLRTESMLSPFYGIDVRFFALLWGSFVRRVDWLYCSRHRPVSFTCAVFEDAGLSSESIAQFRSMLAAEHG